MMPSAFGLAAKGFAATAIFGSPLQVSSKSEYHLDSEKALSYHHVSLD